MEGATARVLIAVHPLQGYVAHLRVTHAVMHLAVDNEPGAETGTDCDVDEVLESLGSTPAPFA